MGQAFWKYFVTNDRGDERRLHVVARKGGEVVYTLCGGAVAKKRTRTITSVRRSHYVCTGCAEAMR